MDGLATIAIGPWAIQFPQEIEERAKWRTNLKTNLAEGAPLLIAPPLHTTPVRILHTRMNKTYRL